MTVIVDLLNASSETMLPAQEDFQTWANAAANALESDSTDIELSVRLIDEEESATLNENYRHKQGATNILSFPFAGLQIDSINFLGDLAICAQIVKREAAQQNKTLQAHWAHMTVHGVLHLHGYDHEDDAQAQIMEGLEIDILKTLGFTNPYH